MKFTDTWTGNWENAFRGLRHPMESYAKSDSAFGIADNDVWFSEIASDVAYNYVQDKENFEEERDNTIDWLFDNGALRYGKYAGEYAFLGPNDVDLAQRMIKAGSPNDKFLRQIFVSVDITGPLYWWKELDTYKVGTTANSTSTMHKLASTPITIDCFEMDDFNNIGVGLWAAASKDEYEPEPNYNELIGNFGLHEDNYNSRETVLLNDVIKGHINFLERLRRIYLETKDIRYWKELIRWLPESWLQTRTFTCNYAVLRNIIHWRKGHKLTEWSQFIDWTKTLPYSEELLFYSQFDN